MEQTTQEPIKQLPIVVSGRTFRAVTETTYEQDLIIMQLLSDAGLLDYARRFNAVTDNLDRVAEDLVIQAFRSGKIFEILAATLVEENVPWSLNQVVVNGEFFSKLTKKVDKEALRGAIVGVLFGFFVSGVISSETSQRYSSKSVAPENALDPNEGPSTSESGLPSSVSLPTSTAPDTPTS